MMSIPTSTTAASTPAPASASPPAADPAISATTGSTAGAPASDAATPASGFVALIDALLQAVPAPVIAAAMPAPVAATPPTAIDLPAAGDPSDDAVLTPDLLAALGLTSTLPGPAPAAGSHPAPTSAGKASKDEASTDPSTDASKAAALAAAVLALTNALRALPDASVAKAASPGTDAASRDTATSQAVVAASAQTAAPAPPAPVSAADKASPGDLLLATVLGKGDGNADKGTDADGKAIESLLGAPNSGDSAGSDGANGTQGNLNAWAAAAHRLSGTPDGRTPAASADAGLRESVGTPRWKDELGARITLMAAQGQQSGSLRLSPEHLGPLEIQITVGDDKTTNVQFGAQHAETRAALQEALPRLRELFASAGLQLGDAGVSGQAPRQRPTEDSQFGPSGYDGAGDGELTPIQGPVRSITHSGLLDTYA